MSKFLIRYFALLGGGVVLLMALLCAGILWQFDLMEAMPWLLIGVIAVGILLGIAAVLCSRTATKSIAATVNALPFDGKAEESIYSELLPLMHRIAELHHRMEEQRYDLSDQRERLQILMENMREGLILTDSTGEILTYNSAALHLLGKDSHMVHPPHSVYALNDSAVFHEIVSEALGGEHGETVVYSGDLACQLIANPVANPAADVHETGGVVLVLLDITEREKRDALRREFTSNVSHELKTPLTSIYGIADMLATGLVKSEDVSGFSRRIRDESSRMITLIEDIIRLSRLDDDSFSEEVVMIDLYQTANAVLMQLQPTAEEKHLTMTLRGSSVTMRGVAVIVEEMLYNLCDNAIKYNIEEGSVKMTVKQTPHHAIFTVTDTGIGVSPADCERIFERFYRVDKSHSRQIGGTGLGLSIVKHGAAFHNAKIEMKSQLGKGTKISLLFPRE
ncbi:MAG: PAS domain-containing protein [Oscillospiraceae bacterium]|nr:PAS domain-containing protein [Oscillospiraceae bacterium]